ncbi:MAG: amino acid adenylation domain-containing protein [Halanaerobiales bacterium]|nr:amino acid adenylation domain-containing protein [Halanaerobiales bacterium]
MYKRQGKIEKQNVQDILALTPMQEGILFHFLKNPESKHYFEQLCLTIHGKLNLETMKTAWAHVVESNELLRTVFVWEKLPNPMQILLKSYQLPIRSHDLSNLDDLEKEKRLKMIKEQAQKEKVDISTEPLRVILIFLSAEESMMIISNHHILFDGWSNGIILKELFQAYNRLSDGLGLEKLTKNSFKKFINWLQKQNKNEQKNYWTEYLAGFDSKTLLPISLDIEKEHSEINRFTLTIDQGLTRGINELVIENHITTATVIYSLWGMLLQRYNNAQDVVFGTTVSGRNANIENLEEMVGLFINTIPLRVNKVVVESIISLLQDIDLVLKERTKYENFSLVEIKNCSEIDSKEDIFDSIVVIENYPLDRQLASEMNHLKIKVDTIVETINFDLTLAVELGDQIIVHFIYDIFKFDEKRIQSLAKHFTNLLVSVLENPKGKLEEVEMLSKEEKEFLLTHFNRENLSFPKDKNVCGLFEDWAEKIPNKISVKYMNEEITFMQLNQRANQLARTLRNIGITKNQPVGIMAERSIELIVGILGILKVGGAYLPINPAYPNERVKYMLEDSGANLLLTHEYLTNTIVFNGQVIALEEKSIYMGEDSNLRTLDSIDKMDSLAYIIYTSGSTGNPKGVMVPYRALNNFLFNIIDQFEDGIGIGDRCLSLTNISFDVSVCEIFLPLSSGATLVLFNNEMIPDILKLTRTIIDDEITFTYIPPTILKELYGHLRQEKLKLNKMLVGVEPIQDYILEDYLTLHPKMQIINGYGPTEATICATFYKYGQKPSTGKKVPIGIPLANTQIYIIDQNHRLVPYRAVGELCITGAGLAEGYLNKADLTAEKFVSNPFILGTRMYKTGDLARWLPDGNIEFLGRIDHQVKVRGFRVELGEIENQLLRHADIKETIVITRKDGIGNNFLCAFIVSGREFTVTELKEYLSQKMPSYMIPSFFMRIEKIPFTPNGKIDRNALLEFDLNIATVVEYIVPETETEKGLAKIWQEVLETNNRIGVNDNFFDLGGHSLRAMTLLAKIHKKLDVELALQELFERPTIKSLAKYIEHAQKSKCSLIYPVEEKEYYPLSSAQKRLFILNELDKDRLSYNMPIVMEIKGSIDQERFEKSCRKLIERHETLRTSFAVIGDEPVQKINNDVEFAIEYLEADEIEIDEKIKEFIRPFDLSKAPLFRARVMRLSNGTQFIMFDIHHIISDGFSIEILIRELSNLYEGIHLPKLKVQYKDYAVWQEKMKIDNKFKQQEEYWLEQFKGEIPLLNFPTDHVPLPYQNFEGAGIEFSINRELTDQLVGLAKNHQATVYMVLFAVYNILLYKYSDQEDLIVGSPIAGRQREDVQNIVGMFVNMLPFRNKLRGNKKFDSFLFEVKENVLQGYENQDYQYDELVEKLGVIRDLSRNPLFDIVFAFQNMDMKKIEITDFAMLSYPFEKQVAKFDLTLNVTMVEKEVNFTLEYKKKLFKRETIERLGYHFIKILEEVVANPEIHLFEIEILTVKEKNQLLYEFNNTITEYPNDQTIHHLFEKQVEKMPENIAIVFETNELSYRKLNQKANQLARLLREKGVRPDTIVGIMVERSLEMVIGVMGILKAGAAYLPIDPDYPSERIKYILEDSQVQILLTQLHLKDQIIFDNSIVCLDDEKLYQGNHSNLEIINHPWDLAYIIYTSGSTGKPKGAMIEHRSLVNLSVWHQKYYQIDETDRSTKYAGFGFDASVWEIFPYLMVGASIYIIGEEIKIDVERLNQYFEAKGITISFLPTQICEQFMKIKNRSLRKLLTGGDKLKYYNKQNYEIINNYGPTENTVVTTSFVLDDQYDNIPIGKPIANTRVYIVDSNNKLQPVGVVGELCISGDGLARAYLNRAELTAEKFVENPFVPGERMYRTGDMARWLSDGNIEFMGRIDHQVQIRGFRVELGEIESQLLKIKEIKEAVVMERVDHNGEQYLCAYIVSEKELSLSEMREKLSVRIPYYIIPSYFIQIDQMPVTPNGKINKKALPEPEKKVQIGGEYEAPQNEVEEILVGIWQEVLSINEIIGVNDNFFELGGHSLKATTLTAKIHKEFQIELPLTEFFKNPTIKSTGKYINHTNISIYSSIEPVKEKEYYPLSSAQKRIYVLSQFEEESLSYNMPSAMKVESNIDEQRFEEAFWQLIKRHESLRTGFEIINDEPVQKVYKDVDFKIEYIEVEEKEIDGTIERFIRPFELSNAPLLRVGLIKLPKDQYIMIFDMHHIISDGVSTGILIDEFSKLYKGENLPELRVQYKDYSVWQWKMLKTDELKKQEEYWLAWFKGEVPVLKLPTDYLRPEVQSFEGKSIDFKIDEELAEQIRDFSRENDVTLYMVLLAAYNVLLYKYAGQKDILIGSPVAGRIHADSENIIGMFVNTLVMRNHPDETKTFYQLLLGVKENALKAYENQDYPFDDLVEKLDLRRELNRNPLFDTMFAYQNMNIKEIQIGDLKLYPYHFEHRIAKFDLFLTIVESGKTMDLILEYSTALFKQSTVQKMAERYIEILEQIIENRNILLKDVNIAHKLISLKVNVIEDEGDFRF